MNYAKAAVISNEAFETNDCTVKAVAIACNVAYRVAHKAMANQGRKNRQGSYVPNIHRAIESLGYKVERVETTAKTVTTLEKDSALRKGHFVAYISRHILAVKDGVVEDWSRGSRRRIESVYRVTPNATRKERKEMAKAVFNK